MTSRYDPSIVKITLPKIEWEKLPILGEPEKEHGEKPKKKRKKRRSQYQVNRKRLLEIFESQYANVKWNLFGTLSFSRKDLELWRGKQAFDEWIGEMVDDDARQYPRWLRVTEHMAPEEGCRFHVFLKPPCFISKYISMVRWKHFVGGEADLWYVTSAGAARQYLANAALRTSDFEIEYSRD